jgi:hypothetical protein
MRVGTREFGHVDPQAQVDHQQGRREGAWVVNYTDAQGCPAPQDLRPKEEADAFAATCSVEVREGTHVADSATCTVQAAGAMWLESGRQAGLERTTLDQYRQHLDLHINPFSAEPFSRK